MLAAGEFTFCADLVLACLVEAADSKGHGIITKKMLSAGRGLIVNGRSRSGGCTSNIKKKNVSLPRAPPRASSILSYRDSFDVLNL
jgi:hypothetical protein